MDDIVAFLDSLIKWFNSIAQFVEELLKLLPILPF